MHPLLAEALELFKGGAMSEREYEAERQRILRDEIGIGEAVSIAPAPAAPKAAITVAATDKAAEARRIQETIDQARKAGRLVSLVPKAEKRPERVATSVTETTADGEIVRRILSDDEINRAVAAQVAKAAVENRSSASAPMPLDIPRGFEVVGGVLRPIPAKVTGPDPIVEAVRKRWMAGEFGPKDSAAAKSAAQAEIKRLKADKPITTARVPCRICKGNPDKIIGKLCACEGKGFLTVDTTNAIARADRGAGAVDPLPENPEAVTYTAYLTSGGSTTIHADNGTKAIRGACESLRAAANGFERVTLDGGVMLVLHHYETQCPACHGAMHVEGKTCVQCVKGRVAKVGGRFYFGDTCGACKGLKFTLSDDGSEAKGCAACNETGRHQTPAADRAHEAGLRAMQGWDPSRECGRKKCKGAECRACRDAKMGGYQRPGYVKCGECKGTGKIAGEAHERCRGKGYFTTTEFYWIDSDANIEEIHARWERGEFGEPDTQAAIDKANAEIAARGGFSVTNEIRRVDLLREDRIPKRDRNITIKIGNDDVEVGAGKVPSRKSGAVMHLTGTARKKYDNARDVYGSQEIVKGRDGKRQWSNKANQGVSFGVSVHNDRSTFSDG
jgi:hypothetical protein